MTLELTYGGRTHEARLRSGPSVVTPVCSCGWGGANYDAESPLQVSRAELEYVEHMADMREETR